MTIVELDIARLIAMVAWGFVVATRLPSMARLIGGTPRFYDPLSTVFGEFGILTLLFCLRWFLSFNTDTFWFGLYILSAAIASHALYVLTRFERGAPNA